MSHKRYKLEYVPIEDSDQPVHLLSLIRVFNGQSIGSQRFKFRRKTKTQTRLCVCTHARIQKVSQSGSKFDNVFFLCLFS